jgi:hypothetical protein
MSDQLFSERHCSLGGRSWTDSATNTTLISKMQLEQCMRRLLVNGKTPSYYRPVFLHEAMHHWCFLSPVGSTLAYLKLRASEHAARIPLSSQSTDAESDLLEDLIRYRVTSELMRPLAEGLALFAQYDAMPSFSPVLSKPMDWLTVLFGLDEDFVSTASDPAEQITDKILYLLSDARLDEQAIESKMGLLVKKLQPSVDSYLSGYLFVKNLYRFAVSQCRRFMDTDLFLAFLRAFFYDDLGLVAALLDPETREVDTTNAISLAFQDRIEQFFTADLAAKVARFEEKISRLEETETDFYDKFNIFNDTKISRIGRERLRALKNMVDAEPVLSSNEYPWTYLHELQKDVLLRRYFMRVGSLQVSVSSKDSGEMLISRDGRTFWTSFLSKGTTEGSVQLFARKGDSLEEIPHYVTTPQGVVKKEDMLYVQYTSDATSGVGDGSLDLYFPEVGNFYRACTITREGKLVACIFCDPINPDPEAKKNARAEFMRIQSNHMELEEFNEVCNELIETMEESSWIKIPLGYITKSTKEVVDGIYIQNALSYVPDEKLDECLKIMSRRGYYGLLGDDVAALKALALLDNCCSLTPNRKLIAKFFALHNMDLDASLALLKGYGKQYSMPRVIEKGNDRLFCMII